MRRGGANRKRDATEPAIIAALEAIGAVVLQLTGDGIPDLLVHWRGHWQPLEVKSPGGRLTTSQQALQQRVQVPVVETPDQALALFGVATVPIDNSYDW